MYVMNRTEYYRGKPNVRYGIWNSVSKQFQFNISEDTPFLAIARLYQKIGTTQRKQDLNLRNYLKSMIKC